MSLKQSIARTFAATALVVLASGANAALVSCPGSFVTDPNAKVVSNAGSTAVSACQILTPPDPSNVGSIANINSAGFFGFSDWESNGQNQIDTVGSAGNWSIANADFAKYAYIIVFKSGAGTNLTAFLFNGSATSGRWTTPFTSPPFTFNGNTKSRDVSHLTIARRAVPEPGSLVLLGLGLAGLGAMRKFRKPA